MSALQQEGPLSRRRPRRARAIAAGLVMTAALLVALTFDLLSAGSDDAIHEALSAGKSFPAPELDLAIVTAGDLGQTPRGWWRAAQDGRVSIHELRGRPVVISFWAPRCGPCRREARALDRAARQAGRDVLALGVGFGASSRQARDFVHGLGLSFPQIHDATGAAARRWGVDGAPATFFLDRDGRIVGHVAGVASAADVREGVAAALTGRLAGLRTGGPRERPD